MKRFGLYIILLYVAILLAGCHDKIELPGEPTPQPRAEAERTVIVYMAADNQPYLPVKEDTTEMVKGKNLIPEDVNFIIYLDDRSRKPAIYELSAKNGMKLWKLYDEEKSSTDASVMLEALRQIEYYFPARHYGITFWSHATGWSPEHSSSRRNTFGKDENPASGKIEMEIPVLRDVLTQLPKFDYIFFDACFMQCIEVAYELRHVTDWMVGSPAEIPGPGAPYDIIMEALCKGDAKGIVQGYDSGYPQQGTSYTGVLLSCIDCTQLEPLAQATGHFLTPFYMERSEQPTTGFQFYSTYIEKYTYCFDMRTTMYRLLSPENYASWMELFDKAVPLHTLSSTHTWFAPTVLESSSTNYQVTVQSPECYGGVSMFVPLNKYDDFGWNEDFKSTSWYAALGWALTGW